MHSFISPSSSRYCTTFILWLNSAFNISCVPYLLICPKIDNDTSLIEFLRCISLSTIKKFHLTVFFPFSPPKIISDCFQLLNIECDSTAQELASFVETSESLTHFTIRVSFKFPSLPCLRTDFSSEFSLF